MKILFIDPREKISKGEKNNRNRLIFLLYSRYYAFRRPLAFSILAALTPNHYEISVIQGGINEIDFDKKYDLVGLTTTTVFANIAYKIADEFRSRGVTVVIGGWHASALPEETKQHADSVVVGEADETWPQLLKDFENKKLKPFYIPIRPVNLDLIPHAKNVYPLENTIGIHATRGCPNGCEFCSITNMKYRRNYRMRPIKEVIGEIRSSTNKVFAFQDASITTNTEYTKKLFKELIPLNKKFSTMGNIHDLDDEELLKVAQEAGCYSWVIGFESINQKSLDTINKKKNKVKDFSRIIKKIQDYDMAVDGCFIFGFDFDTIDIFDETDNFIRKNNIKMSYLDVLVPFPGTPIFERFEREGRILSKDWSKYDGHNYVVYQPKLMSPEILLSKTQELEKRWHTKHRSIERIIKNIRFGFNNFIEVTTIELALHLKKKGTKSQNKK